METTLPTKRTGLTFAADEQTDRYIGRCGYKKSCGYIVARDVPKSAYHPASEEDGMNCPQCKRWSLRWERVQGIVSNHKCDSRCTGAKGADCECSCRGANHGANFL